MLIFKFELDINFVKFLFLLTSASLDPSTSLTKICNRSFYILQAWIEDCYSVDFATNTDLLGTLKEFISSKVIQNFSRSFKKKKKKSVMGYVTVITKSCSKYN